MLYRVKLWRRSIRKVKMHTSASWRHSQDVVVWLHWTVSTSKLDTSTAAETHVIGRRRVKSKMTGAMLLATLLWLDKANKIASYLVLQCWLKLNECMVEGYVLTNVQGSLWIVFILHAQHPKGHLFNGVKRALIIPASVRRVIEWQMHACRLWINTQCMVKLPAHIVCK